MDTPESPAPAELNELWATLEMEPTLELTPSATILPRTHVRGELPGEVTDPVRPIVPPDIVPSEKVAAREGFDVEVGPTIGSGGMGIVRMGRQLSLHREVALKTLQPKIRDPNAERALLQEAWMTGILEHPNIIPIYALGEDGRGTPLIVMKRIEGQSWRDYVAGRIPVLAEGFSNPLRWHISILLDVCNAVHFAHSKGIVHRDIKPDNVMIGAFGEVYLLDWGLALSLHDDLDGRLPLAADVSGVAGTPHYMAPEMTTGIGRDIDERTDVYLLGATLHEILTGAPPHDGASIFEIMYSAYRSEPGVFPASIPEELAEICNRATHVDPGKRFQDARELRSALLSFLDHQESHLLSHEAEKRLDTISAVVTGDPTKEVDFDVHNAFAECRFGYTQALRLWDDNQLARDGLNEGLRLMTRYELDRENVEAATAHLAAMSSPDVTLEREVRELASELESRKSEMRALKRMERDYDPTIGSRRRRAIAILGGLVAAGSLLMIEHAGVTGTLPMTRSGYIAFAGILAICVGGGLFALRRVVLANRVNRRIFVGTITAVLCIFCYRVSAALIGVAPFDALSTELIVYGLCFAMLALVTDLRILWATAVLCVGSVVGPAVDPGGLKVVAGAIFVAFLIMAWAWQPSVPEEAKPVIPETSDDAV